MPGSNYNRRIRPRRELGHLVVRMRQNRAGPPTNITPSLMLRKDRRDKRRQWRNAEYIGPRAVILFFDCFFPFSLLAMGCFALRA